MDYGDTKRRVEQEIYEHHITELIKTVPYPSRRSSIEKKIITEKKISCGEQKSPPDYKTTLKYLQGDISSLAADTSDRRFTFILSFFFHFFMV